MAHHIAVLSKGTIENSACSAQLTALERSGLEITRIPILPRTEISTVLQKLREQAAPNIDGVILPNVKPVDERFLDLCGESLRVISLPFVGTDGINFEAVGKRGIGVATAAGVNAEQTAAQAVALLFDLRHELRKYSNFVRTGQWASDPKPREVTHTAVSDQSIGIIGFGDVGRALTRQLIGHQGRVVLFVSSRFLSEEQRSDRERNDLRLFTAARETLGLPPLELVDSKSLAEKIPAIENLIIAAAHRPGAAPVVDRSVLEAMVPGTAVVNVARGELVDEGALLAALNRGVRFATDVGLSEPFGPGRPWVTHQNSGSVTPHVAGATKSAQGGMFTRALSNLLVGLGLRPGTVEKWALPPRS